MHASKTCWTQSTKRPRDFACRNVAPLSISGTTGNSCPRLHGGLYSALFATLVSILEQRAQVDAAVLRRILGVARARHARIQVGGGVGGREQEQRVEELDDL